MKLVSRRSLGRFGAVLAALVCLFATPVHAQIPVTDGAHIGINKMAWVQQYGQLYTDYQNQISQIQNQYQQIQTQIQDIREQQVNGLNFQSNLGPRDNNLQRRAENAFLEERCGSLGGGGLGGIFTGGAAGPERVNEARLRQYSACTLLVRLENRRFNFMVDVATKLRETDQEMQRLQAEAASIGGNERGRLDRNTNAQQALQAAQVQEMETTHRHLQIYDQQINALKSEIAWAGQSAFSNKRNSLFGQVVQYGTLKAALEVARSRDR